MSELELQNQLQEQLSKLCKSEIDPYISDDEDKAFFRHPFYQKLGELGFCGMSVSPDYGGSELSCYIYQKVLETLSYHSVPYAITLSVSSMVSAMINEFGTKEQKEQFLPDLASGKGIGAFALSEAGAGSDAASLKTKAVKDGDYYILNGTKMWITSAGIASVYLLMARTGQSGSKGISSFLIPAGTPGLSIGKIEKKSAWNVSPTGELLLDNLKIHKKYLLGKEGEGFSFAMNTLDKGRLSIASIATGLAQRAFEEAISFAQKREQFNSPLYEFQSISFMLAEMSSSIERQRAFNEKIATLFDQKQNISKYSSMCKFQATDMCMQITIDAIQIHGGVGFTKEFPVERFMREAKALQIVEGANQIQKIIIAKHLKKEFQI